MPSALLSMGLLLMWLLLNESLGLGQILLGLVLALSLPPLLKPLMPFRARVRRPLLILRLLVVALIEVVRSCYNVALIILRPGREGANSEFISIPLDLRDPMGLAVLAGILNCTPGTVWVEILPDTGELALHVLDMHDAGWWVETVKTRYERPLIQIFESGAT
jgi:multicomponent K+:H+ antiporter subunit E